MIADQVTAAAATAAPEAATAAWGRLPVLARELALVGGGLLAYQASRLLGGRDVTTAFDNAAGVLRLERSLGLPAEDDVQRLLLGAEPVVRLVNGFYATAHLTLTGLCLAWLFLVRRTMYRRVRAALFASTTVALAVYLLLPVAPPRMLPGFVDTAAVHGQSVYAGAGSLANQYAALPSLHVGWAVLVALAGVRASRSSWRWLWPLHPVATVAVVVVTGNHFWLDAAAGAALAGAAWWLAARPWRPRQLTGAPTPA